MAFFVAVRTGLEPVTPCVTGMYSNQTELTHRKRGMFIVSCVIKKAEAVRTGLEPVTPCVTGMYSNQTELTHQNHKWSGKRDSNSRPRPWQGRALPTELLPQTCGRRWIRTTEGNNQQIYSLPHLATLVSAQTHSQRCQRSDSYRIQTYNLLIRSQMLYSVELRSQRCGR